MNFLTLPPRQRRSTRGSGLVLILPLLILIGVVLVGAALFSRRQRTDAGKQARQQGAASAVEGRLGAVLDAGRQLLESEGKLRLDFWVAAGQADVDEGTGYRPTSATADGSSLTLRPPPASAMSNLAADPTSALAGANDLFLGARAFLLPATLMVEAERNNTSVTLGDEGRGETAGAVRWRALTNVRAVPLSQFGYFAGGGATLDAGVFPEGVGRAYVGGDLAVQGQVVSDYRVVVGGNAEVASGATLTARTAPGRVGRTVLDASSRSARWRNEVRPTDTEGAIVTGGEVPTGVAVPATAAEMLAPPGTDLGDKNVYKFSGQAERIVRLASFDAATGTGTFVVTDAAGHPVANSGPWRAVNDPRHAAGPTIEFAYVEHFGASTLARSYYVMSDVPGAMLLLRQTRILTAPLSVATPLPMAIINGLDDLAPGPTPNSPPVVLGQPRFVTSLAPGQGALAVWLE